MLIDLKDLKKTGVFKLKYASEFPHGRDVWEKNMISVFLEYYIFQGFILIKKKIMEYLTVHFHVADYVDRVISSV